MLDAGRFIILATLDAMSRVNLATIDARSRVILATIDARNRVILATLDARSRVILEEVEYSLELLMCALCLDLSRKGDVEALVPVEAKEDGPYEDAMEEVVAAKTFFYFFLLLWLIFFVFFFSNPVLKCGIFSSLSWHQFLNLYCYLSK
jgi:hypothetical protein